jgi:HPt (histidine-containing phosphotransfer) domain-containing protein
MSEPFEFDSGLVTRYLERRGRDLVLIETALASCDFATIANLGHQWKGNAISFGFPELADLGKDLEMAAEASDKKHISDLMEKVRSFVESRRP